MGGKSGLVFAERAEMKLSVDRTENVSNRRDKTLVLLNYYFAVALRSFRPCGARKKPSAA